MPSAREARFDFRGGVNRSFTQDSLDRSELVTARNVRRNLYAGFETKSGSRRLHSTPLAGGAPINGLTQWFPPAGREIVAVAGGNLYYQREGDSQFTEVTASLSTSAKISFQPHVFEGTPRLYIADGTLWSWDGNTLEEVGGDAPDAVRLAIYKTRMFATTLSSTDVYWSRVNRPDEWSVVDGGGQGRVETYDASPLRNVGVTGSSLLLFKDNSIARFTGVSPENIRIDQETEGVASDVGSIGPVTRMDNVLFFVSDRGPFIASEAGTEDVGVKVEQVFQAYPNEVLRDADVVHHRGRRELWVLVGSECWTYDYRVQAWWGPWDFAGRFTVSAASAFELPDGNENVILGGTDGFVRLGDDVSVGSREDANRDGTGGSPLTLRAELPDMVFGNPVAKKRLRVAQTISADLGVGGNLHVFTSGDRLAPRVDRIATTGPGVDQYLFRPGVYGRRIRVSVEDRSGEIVRLNGFDLRAEVSRREV